MIAGTLKPQPILPPNTAPLFSRLATLPMLRRVSSAWMWTPPPDADSPVRTRSRYVDNDPSSPRYAWLGETDYDEK